MPYTQTNPGAGTRGQFGCDVLKSGLWWVAGCEEMVVGARCACGGLVGEASLIEARGGRRFVVEVQALSHR